MIGFTLPNSFLLRADAVISEMAMSAFGPKRTSLPAPQMSAIEGKADIGCRFLSNLRMPTYKMPRPEPRGRQ